MGIVDTIDDMLANPEPVIESHRPDGLVVTPELALAWLREGNLRWQQRAIEQRDLAPDVPASTGQWPFAAILGCADSRVPPEAVFDVTAGNLFSVRNAGNVVDDDVLGSFEFAADRLGVSLIVVLGHTGCGAVRATQVSIDEGTLPGGHVDSIVDHIAYAGSQLPEGHTELDAIRANISHSLSILTGHSSRIGAAVESGRIALVSAVYDLDTRAIAFH